MKNNNETYTLTRKEYPIPKSKWGEGEWQHEPDRLEWIDEYSGYPCIAKRVMHHGAWCGYVGISKGHKLQGKVWGDKEVNKLRVHGGITYAEPCDGDPINGVCHKSDNDDIWWLGFDCAHGFDYRPATEALYAISLHLNPHLRVYYNKSKEPYRDLEYVQIECTKLAKQLRDMEC